MGYMIFDLDGTVICSKHRRNTLPDGSLDLELWMEHNTPDKIANDSLLPMATAMRALYNIGHTIVICTARTWQDADLQFLHKHSLSHHHLLHRLMHPEAMTIGDAQLKIDLLTDFFLEQGYTTIADARAIMWDDNPKVIAAMNSIGISCYDAVRSNESFRQKGWRYAA